MSIKTINMDKAAIELLNYYQHSKIENLINHLQPFLSDGEGKGKSVYYYIYTTDKRNHLISSGEYCNPHLSAELFFDVDKNDCGAHHIITLTKRGNNNSFSFSFDLSGIKVLKENKIKNIYMIRFESDNLLYHLEFVE